MPFSTTTGQAVLTNNVGKYIALMYQDPEVTVDEPAISTATGYARGVVQGWNTSKTRQIANNAIIFMFECVSDLGTFTHYACYNSAVGGTHTFSDALVGEVTVKAGYVPLIRQHEMIIGIDKDVLDNSY